jgi:hypothetical protein
LSIGNKDGGKGDGNNDDMIKDKKQQFVFIEMMF